MAQQFFFVQGTSEGKTYVMWPNCRQKDRLNELLENEASVPSNFGERIMCKVKREYTSTYAETGSIIQNMCYAVCTTSAKLDILTVKTIVPTTLRRVKNNIGFEMITNEQELGMFESNLNDVKYFNEISAWLEDNIFENTPENRMIEILDLLFSKQFLPKCSWTGISKGGVKLSMMTYRNILEVVRIHGSTSDISITKKDIARFFMKKLKKCGTQHKFN
ncbi:uncharacterized protein LOC128718275 [Anopheles marshallii]|uniref:uncharacterized protein LOC128718275 n=1 Tax=Anopheles marshallii TaxID=1521116 RepID=UPI00237A196D|nr:uncharacterized protein LOC128718275 [Anopheles marshallii]